MYIYLYYLYCNLIVLLFYILNTLNEYINKYQ